MTPNHVKQRIRARKRFLLGAATAARAAVRTGA
jgi:hypothetical protein